MGLMAHLVDLEDPVHVVLLETREPQVSLEPMALLECQEYRVQLEQGVQLGLLE